MSGDLATGSMSEIGGWDSLNRDVYGRWSIGIVCTKRASDISTKIRT